MRACPLPEMTPYEETVADFEVTGMTVGLHPVAHGGPAWSSSGRCRPPRCRPGAGARAPGSPER